MSVSQYTESIDWLETNQTYLTEAIAYVRSCLQRQITTFPSPQLGEEPPALEQLCRIFNLSPFERNILLLCAGMEFDSDWGTFCAEAAGDPQKSYPTFSLALSVLPASDWGAFIPTAPLRRERLIELGIGNALTACPLRIDERILHYIAGVQYLDERLLGIVEPISLGVYSVLPLQSSHQDLAQQVATTWVQNSDTQLPVVQLCGEDVASKRAIAFAACVMLNLNLQFLSAEAIPTDITQLNLIKNLCEREWRLSSNVWLLDCEEMDTNEPQRESAIARFIESINCPLIVTSSDRRRQRQRPLITFDVHNPSTDEQRNIWQEALRDIAPNFNSQVESLISHFNLNLPAIHSASLKLKSQSSTPLGSLLVRGGENEEEGDDKIHNQLWDICRSQSRPRLDELAQRIDSAADWEDLILPDKEKQVLRDIAAHVRQRAKVYESWGFAGKSKRGLGISALFAGASGTGKTMSAEVLAKELRLDVYRIDLSSVVSKYIGETEKNLRKLFDAAEGAGAILLFDEADALFGKRSDVKDSHDRHGNIEVSYLLQRMESYRGLAILTSNLKSSIDQAFLRRIRFVVQFPFPDATQRGEIWQHSFPKQTPIEELDFNKLAKLNVAGGNIRNIALNAAFIAADAGEAVGMKHILQAAKSEYIKLERPLTDTEVKGWV